MNDPHVESLTYALKCDESISFNNPPALEEELQPFKVKLEKDVLTVIMKEHCATVSEARAIVDPFLRSWELDVALKSGGRKVIYFQFVRAEMIDRNPLSADQAKIVQIRIVTEFDVAMAVRVRKIHEQYPVPVRNLLLSPDVETLWKRYEGYLAGREPLPGMAYACLSFLQSMAKGRNNLAFEHKIEMQVLDKLGELTSERGDRSEARKFDESSTQTPLSAAERRWIEEAVLLLIRRKAEYDFDPKASLPLITMSSLPLL